MGRRKAVMIAAGLAAVVGAPSFAQDSGPAPAAAAITKSKSTTPAGGAVTVRVTNWRTADLVELEAAESGSTKWKKVLGALKAGHWTSAKLPQGANCRVDLHGKFADGQLSDASNVDVCVDKTVNLTN